VRDLGSFDEAVRVALFQAVRPTNPSPNQRCSWQHVAVGEVASSANRIGSPVSGDAGCMVTFSAIPAESRAATSTAKTTCRATPIRVVIRALSAAKPVDWRPFLTGRVP
jgi:hypothetical protein